MLYSIKMFRLCVWQNDESMHLLGTIGSKPLYDDWIIFTTNSQLDTSWFATETTPPVDVLQSWY